MSSKGFDMSEWGHSTRATTLVTKGGVARPPPIPLLRAAGIGADDVKFTLHDDMPHLAAMGEKILKDARRAAGSGRAVHEPSSPAAGGASTPAAHHASDHTPLAGGGRWLLHSLSMHHGRRQGSRKSQAARTEEDLAADSDSEEDAGLEVDRESWVAGKARRSREGEDSGEPTPVPCPGRRPKLLRCLTDGPRRRADTPMRPCGTNRPVVDCVRGQYGTPPYRGLGPADPMLPPHVPTLGPHSARTQS